MLAMTRPTRHPKTGTYIVRMVVPGDLRETTKRLYGVQAELRENLKTKDAGKAKLLAPAAVERLQSKLERARAEYAGVHVQLSDRDIGILCGRWLEAKDRATRENVGVPIEELQDAAEAAGEVLRGLQGWPEYLGSPEMDAVELMDEEVIGLLNAEGLTVDSESKERLAIRLLPNYRHWALAMVDRIRSGRWKPKVTPNDFPTGTVGGASAQSPSPSTQGCTFDALLSGWALDRGWKMDAKPIPRALYDRQRTLERLADFLGHRDADAVTKADAVRWKEDIQGRGRTAATVRNDVSEMSAVWAWGIRNGKLRSSDNPFQGFLPPKAKKKSREPRAFTDEEASRILQAARQEKGFLRWLPWVLCLTGARLNEVCQSAKEDVGVQDGVHVIRIHDEGEGRTIKNEDSRRTVPIHPALIAEGFLAYVEGLPGGSPLWPDIEPDKVFGLRSTTAGRKVARWLRGDLGITDKLISPNHSWRHWFIGACRRVVMPLEVRSAITGHSAKMDESAAYGDGMGTFVQVVAGYLARVKAPLAG